jgi:hypothetical protein
MPMKDDWIEADDAVEEVREIRRRISAQFGHDPAKVGAYHRALSERFQQRWAEPWVSNDKMVEDLREIRRQLWAEFDNDPEKLSAHFLELQKENTARVSGPRPRDKQGKSAA